jgi:flavin reductase (DIM6/NTAB) family NADH-FMN oxidoreductase RutF
MPDLAAFWPQWAGAVALLTISDGRDDIGATVSAFCPVSRDPALVLVSLMEDSYPAEVLGDAAFDDTDREPDVRFAITLLTAGQRALAGRFAAAGRPAARLMLDDVPHSRGTESGALIPAGGLAAIECAVSSRIPAGDHLVVLASVVSVPYVGDGEPLIRFRGRY